MLITMLETRRGSEDGPHRPPVHQGPAGTTCGTPSPAHFLNGGGRTIASRSRSRNQPSRRASSSYCRGMNGCDATWDICYPDGSFLVSIHFWDRAAESGGRGQDDRGGDERLHRAIRGAGIA